MKAVAFNGSPRADGNTATLIRIVFEELQKSGIETEMVQLGGKLIHGCTGCGWCREKKNGRCVIDDDELNSYVAKMAEADAIIIGSPTYFANVSTETKALIDRAGYVARGNDTMLRRKVGAAVVAVRRAGAIPTYDAINHFLFLQEMIVPGASYWNIGVGRLPGDVEKDGEGVATMRSLGQNIAWLLERLE